MLLTFDVVVRICCVAMRRVCRQHFSIHGIGAVNCVCGSFGCYHGIHCFAFVFVSNVFVVVSHCSLRSVACGSFSICFDACQSLDCYGNTCNCRYSYKSLYPSLPVLIRCQCNQCPIAHPFHIHRHHLVPYPDPIHIRLDPNHRSKYPFLFRKCSSHQICPSIH